MGKLFAVRARAAFVGLTLFALGGCGQPAPPAHPERERSQRDAWPDEPAETGLHIVPQIGHSLPPQLFVVSPDGASLLTGGNDNSVILWDATTGALLRHFHLRTNEQPQAIAFTADGTQAWVASSDGARLYELATGRRVRDIPWQQTFHSWAFSADARIALTSLRGTLVVLDLADGSQKRSLGRSGTRVALSGDGRVAAIESSHGDVECRAVDSSSHLSSESHGDGKSLSAMALSRDGHRLLTRTQLGAAKLWDVDSGKLLAEVKPSSYPSTVSFSPDGAIAAAGDVWLDAQTGATRERAPKTFRAFYRDASHLFESIAVTEEEQRTGQSFALVDAPSGQQLAFFPGEGIPHHRAVTYDGGRRALLAGVGELEVWDMENASLLHAFRLHGHLQIGAVAVSADGRFAVTGGEKTISRAEGPPELPITVWDLETGREVKGMGNGDFRIDALAFSPDGKRVAAGGGTHAGGETHHRLELWDVGSGTLVRALTGHEDGDTSHGARTDQRNAVHSLDFSRDGTLLLSTGFDRTRVWNVESGAMITALDLVGRVPDTDTTDTAFLGDGTKVGGRTLTGVATWDARTGKSLCEARFPKRTLGHDFAVSADGKQALTGANEGWVDVWDLEGCRYVKRLEGNRGSVLGLGFGGDGKNAISASRDGTIREWNIESGASVAMLADGNDWLAYTDDGYFDASRSGGRLVAAVDGMKAFRIDQLAVRNDRPDVLLERLGHGTPEELAHFKARHERRVKQLGLDEAGLTTAFAKAPTSHITDVKKSGDGADVSFTLTATDADLAGYDVWVNGVPVASGAASGRSQSAHETVKLVGGSNRIEVSARDKGGAESLRDYRLAASEPGPPGDLYFLGFGVSHYQNKRLDLSYAHKDVQDLARLLSATPGFAHVHATAYVNEQVTPDVIKKAKAFFGPATVNDTAVVFVAGHGTHTRDAAADYVFVTYNTDVHHLRETTASFDVVEDLLSGIAPRRKLLLLDTCESGERDDADLPTAALGAGQRGLRARSLVLDVAPAAGAPAPEASPRRFVIDRERLIYVDLARRTGAVEFASSRGTEASFERDEIQNGEFTHAILGALTTGDADADKDGVVTTAELREYVAAAVAKATNDQQHPTIDRDNPDARVGLRVARGRAK